MQTAGAMVCDSHHVPWAGWLEDLVLVEGLSREEEIFDDGSAQVDFSNLNQKVPRS